MSGQILQKAHYELKAVSFFVGQRNPLPQAHVYGTIRQDLIAHKFCVILIPNDQNGWAFENFKWVHAIPPKFGTNKNLQQDMVRKAIDALKTINMWPGAQTDQGAKIWMNEIIPPKEAAGKVVNSYRSNLLRLPSPDWSNMWENIKNNISTDPYFHVNGFKKEEVTRVLNDLVSVRKQVDSKESVVIHW